MENKLQLLPQTTRQDSSKMDSFHLNRQMLRENIKFANLNLSNNKSALSIRGKIKRKKMSGAFGVCMKKGVCSLYVDDQKDEHTISVITQNLSKMKNLRKLYLHFRKCSHFGNHGMLSLARSLMMMTNLRSLKLVFQGGETMTNFGVRKLFKSIGKCNALKHLDLRFIVCNNLGDDALKTMKNSFKHLTYLKSLIFHLDWCTGITDAGVQRIEESIYHMKKLKKFRFSMISHQATDPDNSTSLRSVVNFCSFLALSPDLKFLHLNLKRWNFKSWSSCRLFKTIYSLTNSGIEP